MCFEKCSIRFLSVSSGIWALSVQAALPKTPCSRSGLAASMAWKAFSRARPTSREASRTSFQCAPSGMVKRSLAVARGVALVAGLLEGFAVVLVPDVREPLEEEQREDVLLVVAGIDEAAQQRGRAPEVGLELLL